MKVPQHEPWLGQEEYAAIKDCFDTNWVTEGPKSNAFMEEMRALTGAKHCVLAPNGTLALYLALRALGIGPGDEVIVPDFTFIASATSVEMTGATPIFCDINEGDLHLSLEDAERVITPRTKAIMPVHIYGCAIDMEPVLAFAKKHSLKVIEDAAQAVGVHSGKKHCGTFGDIGTFSFFSDKTITMGEGGLVVTNDDQLYDSLRYLRNQGRLNRGSFEHPEIGYNFRTTDILTAIGLVQLKKLPEVIRRKTLIFNQYKEQLAGIDGVSLVMPTPKTDPFIPFRVCIRTKEKEALMNFLSEKGIQPRAFFYPLHKQKCFSYLKSPHSYPHSVAAANEGICLPCFPTLQEDQITYICETIGEFFGVRQNCLLL